MKIDRQDLATPANAMTLVGLVLTIVGAVYLDTLWGITLVVIGRLLDIFDGHVARRTHTSEFGALLDVIADKIAILALGISMYLLYPSIRLFILFVLLQNGLNVLLGLYGLVTDIKASPSLDGKHAMFFEVATLIYYSLYKVAESHHWQLFGYFLAAAGIISAILGIVLGIKASINYYKLAAAHHRQRRSQQP